MPTEQKAKIGAAIPGRTEHFIVVSPAKNDLLILSSIHEVYECTWCPNVACAGQNCFGVTTKMLKERRARAKRILGVKDFDPEDSDPNI